LLVQVSSRLNIKKSLIIDIVRNLGKEIGIIITTPLVSLLCGSTFLGGWPSAFYVFGILSCLWFIGWVFYAYNSPSEHPRIRYAEKLYLLRCIPKPKKVNFQLKI
jgi:hypothetical protein